MTGQSSSSSSSSSGESKVLHLVYSVTNIQTKIHPLDGESVTYSSWKKLFRLHAKGYKVSYHIDGTPSPAKTDPTYESWCEIDAIVLQWIYGTLSPKLMVRILKNESTAQEAWNRLENIFLSNKAFRAAALETRFTNLTLAKCSSLDDYCQKLKEIADQLEDVGQPVLESRLLIQLVNGLPSEYSVTGSLINQSPTTNLILSDNALKPNLLALKLP
ncbi:uncharacterized protein LOC143624001 [Bidens hawaiensis]|uniref:uncharacterized protein LOC143624001 n=1 Tax=Bidens hawaiensis TaxID=980011 RepID=UPI00404AE757